MTNEALEEAVAKMAGKSGWRISHVRGTMGFPCDVTEITHISIDKPHEFLETWSAAGATNGAALEAIAKEITDELT